MIRPRDQDWTARLRSARMAAAGLEPVSYASELRASWLVWRSRMPWRWLPDGPALWVFSLIGNRFATRWIAARGAT